MKAQKSLLLMMIFASVLMLNGCADTATQAPEADVTENVSTSEDAPSPVYVDDHHEGEENVEPHDDIDISVPGHDDAGLPPHRD